METKGKWYAIHTYSGYENAVEKNLKQRIESLGVEDRIFEVLVPKEKRITFKNGKRVEVEKNLYPGYVLVNMIVDDETWYIVRNTPSVSGFVGAGVKPVPLLQAEVDTILNQGSDASFQENASSYKEGDFIRIIDGPFTDRDGTIVSIDLEREKVMVNVIMFGRETPIELDFVQVKRL